ncbi:actin-related protein 10-like [Halichondria panicea]|uniref:actin-related protein 10-like n=1 Tax=Halichondria panicea TaxID=6063 RepID=UPI00312B506B
MSRSISEPTRSRLSASTDKGAIILDIGRIYTRCGFSGEAAPRHIIRSQITMRPHRQLQEVWDPKYINREELYLILCRFIRHVYLKYLMVNPREYRVVVVESLYCPAHFRNTLARALFSHMNVPYAVFIPSHLVSTFTIARSTALVVDVGFIETTILPVCEGIPLVDAWQATSFATQHLQEAVLRLLMERAMITLTDTGSKKPLAAVQVEKLLNKELEDILVRTCFVRSKTTPEDKVPPDTDYPLNSQYTLHIDGYIRDHAADVLFEDEGEDSPIPACILNALMKCPIDARRELSENILVMGGSASLIGFNYRLKQELEALVGDQCQRYHSSLGALSFKFHDPPSHPNCVAWCGASIFGSSEIAMMERAITKDKFKELKQLPEWMSCDPEQQEQLKTVSLRKMLPSAPSALTRRMASQPGKV